MNLNDYCIILRMIAEFPTFGKLSLLDKVSIDKFNAQFPPYADWSFGTLLTWWDAFNDLEVSVLNDNLIISSSYLSMGKERQLVLLGVNDIDATIAQVFKYQQIQGLEKVLFSVPEYTIDAIHKPENFILVEDPNAAEYVLSVSMHATLEGPKMSRKRQEIRQFERSTSEHLVELSMVDMGTLHAKMRLINALHTWDEVYRNDQERLEGHILNTTMLIAESIDIHCLCLLIDKEIHGFVLYKYLPDKTINVSNLKVSSQYPCMFDYLIHRLAKNIQGEDIEYMNLEQDLGHEGLRLHKTLLRPVRMLRKYNIYANA